ncbi:DUF3865 domain-containing protein [Geitlerinema sp. PCC 7407]|uniref:DUF3865 domain-containing protein n=1 Tax=Geitlerinema sp. PCC 7407 TaxID=1173025 RepID=UPI00029FC1FF|nr:DUF3865 domain-containing protein [Geitlerinema sp. PCC 7407]AFY66368.1 hypothetical protein GEI7407_1886 [Geitlerinema sp. PCC 7407]
MQEFNTLISRLNQSMGQACSALDAQRNPMVQIMREVSAEQLIYVLQQYAIFPKALVDLMVLTEQKAQQSGWSRIAAELQDNIAEELGRGTEGVSHYRLLAEGLEDALGVPVVAIAPSPATMQLLAHLNSIFRKGGAYILGASYAIEASSIPELLIVQKMIRYLLQKEMPPTLDHFFTMHLNEWEPEHEADLRNAIAHYLQPEDLPEFEAGFYMVLEVMEIWWKGLAIEAMLYPALDGAIAA